MGSFKLKIERLVFNHRCNLIKEEITMKKVYVKPLATKVQFLYREQVVATSTGPLPGQFHQGQDVTHCNHIVTQPGVQYCN